MTKEELLQKGVSEEDADEIIQAFSQEDEDSLSALQKALEDDPADDLMKAGKAKAEDDDEKGDDDDYNEEYMKKYMKRYMKENRASSKKIMNDLEESGEDMKKAIDDFDVDAEGAVIEMSDLKPILSDQSNFNSGMVKAISEINDQIFSITRKLDQTYDLMQKAAKVQVEQAKGVSEILSEPQGRKGVIATSDMQKAGESVSFSPEDGKVIYTSLMKAVREGDKNAGYVISAYESAGKNVNLLTPQHKQYIHELISKEAN